jgi:arylsulfatase A
VLTGCYAKRVSLPNVIFPAAPVGLNPVEHTVAELLKARGYATMCIGKWHVGDQPEFLPTRHGFDHYFGLPYSNDMGGPADGTSRAKGVRRRDSRPPLPLIRDDQVIETVSPSQQDALTERYTDEALTFIRSHKDTPFFLYFPHTAVHTPLHPGEKFKGKSANGPFGDWVEELDWSVGRVLDTVRELKLAERTLVIFSSDNGPWLTQGTNAGVAGPLRGGKGGTYEGGMREPTIAWWPGRVPAASVCDTVAGNIDFLPTFVTVAGGTVPADRKIDGRDISPLLWGQSKASPREAQYYFSGNSLQAVRVGPWKLAIARQSEGRKGQVAANTPEPFKPTLYNLDVDIGERNDVAAQHPEVVERLQKFIAIMDADLGITKPGPGVREPGRVAKPVGLWLPGQAPAFGDGAAPALDSLQLGDALSGDDAPDIANQPLTITCEVEAKAPNGVIVAQGGSALGYAVYLRDGKLTFTVREGGSPMSIASSESVPGAFKLQARLARGGAMTLAIDGRTVAQGKAAGLIPRQPSEDFCVGHDNRRPVGDYVAPARFTGTIKNLKITKE